MVAAMAATNHEKNATGETGWFVALKVDLMSRRPDRKPAYDN